jgi:hypothetical protein
MLYISKQNDKTEKGSNQLTSKRGIFSAVIKMHSGVDGEYNLGEFSVDSNSL